MKQLYVPTKYPLIKFNNQKKKNKPKNYTSWSSEIYSRYTKVVCHLKRNQYTQAGQWAKEKKKSYNYIKMHNKHFTQSKIYHAHKKNLSRLGIEGIFLILIKVTYKNHTTAIIANDEKLSAFSLRMRTALLPLTLPIQHCTGSSS